MENIEITPEMNEAVQRLADAIVALWNAVKEIVTAVVESIKQIWDYFVTASSNKKVRHLALHAKKYRSRKKNQHRMVKDFLKLLSG